MLPNNNISDEWIIAIANSEKFKNLTDLDIYGNVISDDGVKAIAESAHMSNLKKLSLYGNLVEDEGAIAIAESKILSKLKHLFITSNRIRRDGIEALKNAKSRTRLCHLHIDDLKDFLSEVSAQLDTFMQNYENFMLIGDFNSGVTESSMIDFMNMHNLKNLISDPTCIKKLSLG